MNYNNGKSEGVPLCKTVPSTPSLISAVSVARPANMQIYTLWKTKRKIKEENAKWRPKYMLAKPSTFIIIVY